MPAGYSGKTLVHKLGIKEGDEAAFVDAPADYESLLGRLPDGVTVVREPKGKLDFIQLFRRDKASLERDLPKLKERLNRDGAIWVCWPKRSSGVATDLGDGAVREIGLKQGLVDIKVCAIDGTWSALKFVRRAKDRRASSIGA